MAADRFSPVAPAYIRGLILPVGRIERSRFVGCVQRLAEVASLIPLKDLLPHTHADERLLAPNAFPHGFLLYNYTSSVPNEQQLQLSPFELFREPLLVLGIKDGRDSEGDGAELEAAADQLRDRHPRVVHQQMIVLDGISAKSTYRKETLIHVNTTEEQYRESLWLAALQFSARFLSELSTYIRAMQASPGIQTPGQTARSLQRSSLTKEHDKAIQSRHGTPQQSSAPSSPVKAIDESRAKSPPLGQSPPATSFEQMTDSNGQGRRSARPDSRASDNGKISPRPSSQERTSMQGFGSGTTQEKLKSRGRARVGIVSGSLHMLAGQWGEALRLFVEHTSKARLLSDHIWHAKGLEGIVVCLLLNAWAGLDFQVPSICYPAADRSVSANMQRFSVNIPSDFRLSLEGHPSPISKLATSLPELLTYILKLYSSGEGSLELPLVALSEATIRFSKLLGVLDKNGGNLEQTAFNEIIRGSSPKPSEEDVAGPFALLGSPFKGAVIDMLSTIYPFSDDAMSIADQAGILAGTASVYALLQMHRKEAIIIKEMIVKLTAALVQARKKGAAEMGIHPAATLLADSAANSILSAAEESEGLSKLMADVAATYGVMTLDVARSNPTTHNSRYFGKDSLKLDFMKVLAAFCEAAPDPKGTVRINAAMLRAFGPNVAVDAEPAMKPPVLSKDDQIACVTAINRAVGLANLLGMPSLEAEYWDDFLVRDIEFLPEEPGRAVIDLAALKSGGLTEGPTDGNPLLYDRNTSRPNTAESAKQPMILVQSESVTCRITLQNPYDVPMEVESLKLVADGLDFTMEHKRLTLKPLGIQRFSLSAAPNSAGTCKVTGCMVKIQGCRERMFPIVSKPWSSTAPALVKSPRGNGTLISDQEKGPEQTQLAITVIDLQPTLVVKGHPFKEASLMLLDGEVCELNLTLQNTSSIPASIFDISTTNDAVQLHEIVLEDDSSDSSQHSATTILKPDETGTFTFDVIGKRNVTTVQVMFSYSLHSSTTPQPQYARIITIPVSMTVNAALQVQRLDALPLDIAQNDEDSFVLAFDVGNAWPKSLFYSCFCTDLKLKSAEPRRCHNHEGILAPGQVQRVFMPVARPETLSASCRDPESVYQSLLERLRILWELEDEERKGWVDLTSLSLNEQTREVVIGSAINLNLSLVDHTDPDATTARAGSFITLRAKMHNRARRSIPLIVQLIPHALNSSEPAQLERRIGIAGAQIRFVAPIAEGMEDKVDFVLCPLLVGFVELEVVVKAALEKDEGLGPEWISHKKFSLKVV